jgi:hypothetical protein
MAGKVLHAIVGGMMRIVALLCALAAVRILVYAAAFPPFNPIDEIAHADVVLKYSGGHVPRVVGPVVRETAELFVLYGQGVGPSGEPGGVQLFKEPEYRESARADGPVPVWLLPSGARDKVAAEALASWHGANHEDVEPPVYYAVAGVWDRIGHGILGLRGGKRFYWLRFLNAIFAAGLVWIGWQITRHLGPFTKDVSLGVPILLATIPQDCLYAVTNDALSPVLFGAAFFMLVSMTLGPVTWVRGALAGGLAAATLLTKYTNGALAVPLVFACAASIGRWRQHRRGAELRSLAALVVAVSAPLAAWWIRTWIVAGDPLASQVKYESLGWTAKPVGELTDHPLFHSAAVVSPFWHDLMRTLWRGEFPWHGSPLAWPPLDLFYSVSSALLVVVAARRAWQTRHTHEGRTLTVAALTFAAAVVLMIWISIAFRFSVESMRPSLAYPYFSSGRLIAGTLAPFVLLYSEGLRGLFRRPLLIIGGLAIAMTAAELALSLDVLSSPFNWFAGLGDPRFSFGP